MTNERVDIQVNFRDNASQSLDRVNSRLDSMRSSLSGPLKLAAAGAGVAVIGFAAASVKASSDLGESINAVNVVFGQSAQKIHDWGKTAAENAGLSQRAFNQMATPLGAMLSNAGFSLDETADKTIALTQRAADLASVFNTDVTDALQAIQSALRGEANPIERFGVTVTAAKVELEALAMTGKTSAKELTELEKQTARLNLIFQQTEKVTGDFRNTSDSLANRQRVLTATFEDFRAEIGTKLQPVIEKALGFLLNIIRSPDFQNGVRKWIDIVEEFVGHFARGFNAVVIPALRWLIENKLILMGAIAAIGVAMAAAWGPGSLAVIGALALLTLLGKLKQESKTAELPGLYEQQRRLELELEGRGPLGGGFGDPAFRQLQDVNERIRRLEELEGQSALGAAGNLALGEALAYARQQAEGLSASLGSGGGGEAPTGGGGLSGAASKAKEEVLTLVKALEDNVVDMAEAAELGLTPAMAGAAEGTYSLMLAQQQLIQREFEVEKATAKLTIAMNDSQNSFLKLADRLVRSALDLAGQALSSIFGRPTKEEASLELQIAQVDKLITGFAASSTAAGQDISEAIKPYEQLRNTLQTQLDLMQSENRIMQLEAALADQTLLTEAEQLQMTKALISDIGNLSSWIRNTAGQLGYGLVPAFDAARDAAYDLARSLSAVRPISLQHGGFVPRPTLAVVGDAPGGEWVIPAGRGSGTGATNNYYISGSVLSERELFRLIRDKQRGGGL